MVLVTILARVSALFCLWGVVSAEKFYEQNSRSVLKAEILQNIFGVSRLQCLHKCKIHGECVDIGIRDDGACLLLKSNSSNIKSNAVPDSSSMMPNVERISAVVPPPGKVFLASFILLK